jgi:hypothetical protein
LKNGSRAISVGTEEHFDTVRSFQFCGKSNVYTRPVYILK